MGHLLARIMANLGFVIAVNTFMFFLLATLFVVSHEAHAKIIIIPPLLFLIGCTFLTYQALVFVERIDIFEYTSLLPIKSLSGVSLAFCTYFITLCFFKLHEWWFLFIASLWDVMSPYELPPHIFMSKTIIMNWMIVYFAAKCFWRFLNHKSGAFAISLALLIGLDKFLRFEIGAAHHIVPLLSLLAAWGAIGLIYINITEADKYVQNARPKTRAGDIF